MRALSLPRRARLLVGMVLLVVPGAIGLAGCGGSPAGYEVTARFARAVALYEGADVLVMGVAVGEVTDVAIVGDVIEVVLRVDDRVPVPADATAAIVPSSLIGERTVVLGPAWRPGEPRLADGDVIPVRRTLIPVEPDDALRSVTELLESLDPQSVRRLLSESAGALEGNGATLNSALGELARLLPWLADQDDELLALAAEVGVLADVIRARDTEVGQLLRDFAVVSDALAQERQSIARFLGSLTSLTLQGEAMLSAYETSLPEDLDTLASVALTVRANAGAVRQLVLSLREFQVGAIEAYDPETGSVRARVNTSQTLLNPIIEILLALGIPPPGSGPGPLPLPGLPEQPTLPTIPGPSPQPTVPTIPGQDDDCLPLLDPLC